MLAQLKSGEFFKRFIFKELSWYFFGQIIVQASSFISAIVVTRYLGPLNLGLFSFSQNFVAVLLSLVNGVDFYLTWRIAKADEVRKEMQHAFAYKLRLHAVIALVGVLAAYITLPNDVALLCTILILPSVLQSFTIFTAYALSKNYAKLTGVLQGILAVIFLLVKCVGVYLHAPITFFVLVAALDMVMFGVLMYLYIRSRDENISSFFTGLPQVHISEMVSFLRMVSVSVVSVFFWGLLLRVDQFIIAMLTDATTLGLYSSAVKVAELPNLLAGVITSALTSRIALLPSQEKQLLRKKVTSLIVAQAGVGLLIMLFIVVCAPFLVYFLYGSAFKEAAPMLALYALTIPYMFINYVFHSLYGAFGKLRFQAINYISAVVINTVGSYVGYVLFGVIGLIGGTILAYACCSIFGYLYLRKTVLL